MLRLTKVRNECRIFSHDYPLFRFSNTLMYVKEPEYKLTMCAVYINNLPRCTANVHLPSAICMNNPKHKFLPLSQDKSF